MSAQSTLTPCHSNPLRSSSKQSNPQNKTHYPNWLNSLCQNLLLSAFSKMSKGQLSITLPNGTVQHFGQNPGQLSASLNVLSPDFFTQCVLSSHIGFGEAYVQGLWHTSDIKGVIQWFILNLDESTVLEGGGQQQWWINLMGSTNKLFHKLNDNTQQGSKRNIEAHYDLSNDFFALFLDPTMTYSAAKFTYADQSLAAAQIEKYDSLCKKLKLKPTDHVLEIGSGWGGFSIHAAKNYGCHIHTVTISQAQYALAQQRIEAAGLSDKITIEIKDYREITGQFDKIVSIEMVEAVGEKFLDTYFAQCTNLLKPDGLFAIQMITCPDSRFDILKNNVDFIQKHIFPGSLLLSLKRAQQGFEKAGTMTLYDLEDMGLDYAKTLSLWYDEFMDKKNEVLKQGFDEAFIRKWQYYLKYCEAAFAMQHISVVQAVYSRPNNPTLMENLH